MLYRRCYRQQIVQDIAALEGKYPSIDIDIRFLENIFRESQIPSRRCLEFLPEWVWRFEEVSISAFEGAQAEGRCTLVYEQDKTDCYFLLLYDNDLHGYEEMIGEITRRRGED